MKEKILVAGGVLSALAASTCCIVPLVLASLGVSGVWVGSLHALAPYQPVFILIAIASLGGAFWLIYRRSELHCQTGTCVKTPSARFIKNLLWIKGILWIGATLVAISIGTDYAIPLLF